VGGVPDKERNRRVSITLPQRLVREARARASAQGDVLSDFVRGAIITATRAAEAGHGDQLPQDSQRPPRARGEGVVSFRYLASADEETRCAAALARSGSSPVAVAEEALTSYLAFEGSRLDVVVPGDPWVSARTAGAA
jgi:hypothetical protein